MDAVLLHLGGGHEGLRQHGHGAFVAQEGGQTLGMLGLVFHGHVFFRVNAVAFQQVVQGIFGGGALAAGINGAAPQILKGMDGLFAVFHHVENAQRVDGQHLHLALRVVIEHGGQIGGHGGDIDLALHQLGGDLVDGGSNAEIIAGGFIGHQLAQAHGGGALHGHHPGQGFGSLGERNGAHRQRHAGDQQNGKQLFQSVHNQIFPPVQSVSLVGLGLDCTRALLTCTPGRLPILPVMAPS